MLTIRKRLSNHIGTSHTCHVIDVIGENGDVVANFGVETLKTMRLAQEYLKQTTEGVIGTSNWPAPSWELDKASWEEFAHLIHQVDTHNLVRSLLNQGKQGMDTLKLLGLLRSGLT